MSKCSREQLVCRRGAALQRGFTLPELMITLVILGILTMVAVPSFRDATLGSRLNTSANNLVSSIHLARSEAMKRNAVVTLCVSTNGTTCASGGWQQGWIVKTATTVIQQQQAAPVGFKITGTGGATMSFQPTGIGATATVFTVCRSTPAAGNQERVVNVTITGKPSISHTETGSCP